MLFEKWLPCSGLSVYKHINNVTDYISALMTAAQKFSTIGNMWWFSCWQTRCAVWPVVCWLTLWINARWDSELYGHGPVFLPIIQIQLKSLFCFDSIPSLASTTNFRTCHDSTAVVPCAEFCSKHFIRIRLRAKKFPSNLHYSRRINEMGPQFSTCINISFHQLRISKVNWIFFLHNCNSHWYAYSSFLYNSRVAPQRT